MRYTLLRKESSATGLRSKRQVPGIGAEERDAEGEREVSLDRSHVVGDEVREGRIGDECADPLDQSWAFQHLCC